MLESSLRKRRCGEGRNKCLDRFDERGGATRDDESGHGKNRREKGAILWEILGRRRGEQKSREEVCSAEGGGRGRETTRGERAAGRLFASWERRGGGRSLWAGWLSLGVGGSRKGGDGVRGEGARKAARSQKT